MIVAEKGHALHSGRGRAGNDHFETYIPEVHGPRRDALVVELLRTAKGEVSLSHDLFRAQLEKAFDIVKLWDSWGIPMKYKGKGEFSGHSFLGRVMTHIKYSGHMQKKALIEQTLDRGAEKMNRVIGFELLRDGVIGAIAIHASMPT